MNHCLIQSIIKTEPQMRYTKENQTPIAEMFVIFKGLRNDDPSSELKVLGWGAVAKEMVEQLKEGQKVVLEGRLRMNSITRKDGTKEKQPELTASRIHQIALKEDSYISNETLSSKNESQNGKEQRSEIENTNWNSAPLVPEVDEIPF